MSHTPPCPLSPRNHLAGFESSRDSVWGAAVVRKMGLVLLPSLAEHDVYAEGDELDRLDADVDVLLHNIQAIAPTPAHEESIRFRLENVREAIRLARQVEGGGVYIG